MSISTPFIRRPIATSLFIAALVLVGLAAYPLLPVAPLPRVDFPTINVNVKFPGASPETMASTVAQPLERQFGAIAGIAQMTSVSVAGSTQISAMPPATMAKTMINSIKENPRSAFCRLITMLLKVEPSTLKRVEEKNTSKNTQS